MTEKYLCRNDVIRQGGTALPRMLRFTPEIRTSYIERFESAPPADTVYTRPTYIDEGVLKAHPEYVKLGFLRLVKLLASGAYDIVELPEPLWLRQWPETLLLSVVAKIGGFSQRRKVELVTYAIENGDPALLFRWFPEFVPNWIRMKVLWLATVPGVLLYSKIAFGTSGAQLTYQRSIPRFLENRLRSISRVIDPLPERIWSGAEIKSNFVFLGAFENRKGVPQLLAAWDVFSRSNPGHLLTMIGRGPLENEIRQASAVSSIVVNISPPRAEIHDILSKSKVLILLSQPEGSWREQIGLPILEGIAHGCRILTTDQTGIATWLGQHNHLVLSHEASAIAISEAMIKAAQEQFSPMDDSWSEPNGRAVAAEWMYGER